MSGEAEIGKAWVWDGDTTALPIMSASQPRSLRAARSLHSLTVAAWMMLGGCAIFQPAEPAPEPTPEPVTQPSDPPPAPLVRRPVSDAETLLSYFSQLRKLSTPELAREHDIARQAYGGARSDYNRVRLAMIMTLPNTAFYDEPRALDLLEPLARNSGAPLSGLALLLASQLQERKRLDANAQALQQKLDALKSLERSLIERKR